METNNIIKAYSGQLSGIAANTVTVEVQISPGIGIHLVGLADSAVKESLLRTITALQSQGYLIPGKKVIINLAPVTLHKSGSEYDLPIALALLSASGQATLPDLGDFIIAGELSLDAQVRNIRGGLLYAELASREGKAVILPMDSANEVRAYPIPGLKVYGVTCLSQALRVIRGEGDDCLIDNIPPKEVTNWENVMDFWDGSMVDGKALRAIEIAAAGGHGIAFVGQNRIQYAKLLHYFLPAEHSSRLLDAMRIWSAAGFGGKLPVIKENCKGAFRLPHFSSPLVALLGGGRGDDVLPGEVSLAQGGLLFLNDYNRAPRTTQETLRHVLEDKAVTIARLRSKITYPADFQLALGFEPCPCRCYLTEYHNDCTCSPEERKKYLSTLPTVLLEKTDIMVRTAEIGVEPERLTKESIDTIRERIARARKAQGERQYTCNGNLTNRNTEFLDLSEEAEGTFFKIAEKTGFSARGYCSVIRVARTIADLEGSRHILPEHITEAIGLNMYSVLNS